jgi:asparagine synthase (glutamine-hydrolysing)
MCGICGFINNQQSVENEPTLLKKMCEVMIHRGPDEDGYYLKNNVALGHRRLSIIDLSSGSQPMSNDNKSIWIVFNGEIYNFPEIKKALVNKGFSFKTRSDTEVIIKAYEAYGIDLLQHLNGMYAFAIWDENKKRLMLARDRMGKKPLYYYVSKQQFIFASELKAILLHPEVRRDINIEAVDKYFSLGYVPSPLTIFSDISKLRPAHYLLYQDGRVNIEQYWDVQYGQNGNPRSEDDYIDELEEILQKAIKRRLISDVPLGAFLSGGLDSSAVVALMSKISNEPVKTFTIGFSEQTYSEVNDAKCVADKFHTDHQEFTVETNAIELLPKLIWHFDEPFADSSAVPTFYVSKMAREHVTVILSGDGGDELFAGYWRYIWQDKFNKFKKIPRYLREQLLGKFAQSLPFNAKGKNYLLEISQLEKKQNLELLQIYPYIKSDIYSHEFKTELKHFDHAESLIHYWENMPVSPQLSRMQYFDTKMYLPEDILVKVDRMSMANSLETRAPLLDYHLVEFAAKIPAELQMKDGKGKYIFRKMASRILPAQILTKKKQGFAIPANEWFKTDLYDYAYDLLSTDRFRNRGYFNQKNVELMLREHRRGRRDYSNWIWTLIIFELWYQTFLDANSRVI